MLTTRSLKPLNILSLPRLLQAPHVSPLPRKENQPHGLQQGCTNIGQNVAVATKFFTLAPNVYGSSEWNLLHITQLTSRISRCFPDFLLKVRAFLVKSMCLTSQLESLPNLALPFVTLTHSICRFDVLTDL
jgi:hypothetical protein